VTPETLTSLSNSDDYCELGVYASLSSISIVPEGTRDEGDTKQGSRTRR
jgi:hypothetical protein